MLMKVLTHLFACVMPTVYGLFTAEHNRNLTKFSANYCLVVLPFKFSQLSTSKRPKNNFVAYKDTLSTQYSAGHRHTTPSTE